MRCTVIGCCLLLLSACDKGEGVAPKREPYAVALLSADYETALRTAHDRLGRQPQDAIAQFVRMICAFQLDRYDELAAAWSQAPRTTHARREIAAWLESLLSRVEDDAFAHFLRGAGAEIAEDREQAVAQYRLAHGAANSAAASSAAERYLRCAVTDSEYVVQVPREKAITYEGEMRTRGSAFVPVEDKFKVTGGELRSELGDLVETGTFGGWAFAQSSSGENVTWAPLVTAGRVVVRAAVLPVVPTKGEIHLTVKRACRKRVFDFGARFFIAEPATGEGFPVFPVPDYLDVRKIRRGTMLLGTEITIDPIQFVAVQRTAGDRSEVFARVKGQLFRGGSGLAGGIAVAKGYRRRLFGDMVLKVESAAVFGKAYRAEQITLLFWIEDIKDEDAWAKTRTTRDADAYRRYLDKFPKGRYQRIARNRIDEITSWELTKIDDTRADYESFRSRFPKGVMRKEVDAALRRIDGSDAWKKAQETDTAAAYESFLAKFPESRHILLAKGYLKRSRMFDLVTKGNVDAVVERLQSGTSLELADRRGRTLLHVAVEANQLEVAKALVRAGVDIHARDNEKKRPIDLARAASNTKMCHVVQVVRAGEPITDGTAWYTIHVKQRYGVGREAIEDAVKVQNAIVRRVKGGTIYYRKTARGLAVRITSAVELKLLAGGGKDNSLLRLVDREGRPYPKLATIICRDRILVCTAGLDIQNVFVAVRGAPQLPLVPMFRYAASPGVRPPPPEVEKPVRRHIPTRRVRLERKLPPGHEILEHPETKAAVKSLSRAFWPVPDLKGWERFGAFLNGSKKSVGTDLWRRPDLLLILVNRGRMPIGVSRVDGIRTFSSSVHRYTRYIPSDYEHRGVFGYPLLVTSGPVVFWKRLGEARGLIVIGPGERKDPDDQGIQGERWTRYGLLNYRSDMRRVFLDIRGIELQGARLGSTYAGFIVRDGKTAERGRKLLDRLEARPVCCIGSSDETVAALREAYAKFPKRLLILDEFDADRVGDFLLRHELPPQPRSYDREFAVWGTLKAGAVHVRVRKRNGNGRLRYAIRGNRVEIEVTNASEVRLFCNDELFDLDRPLTVVVNGKRRWNGPVQRTWTLIEKKMHFMPALPLDVARLTFKIDG